MRLSISGQSAAVGAAEASPGDRCDGFDYRIYYRFHQQEELVYLEHTQLSVDEPDRKKWLQRVVELLAYDLHRCQHRIKLLSAPEPIEQMEPSEVAPEVHMINSALFSLVVIEVVEKHGKPWLAYE